MSHVLNCTSVCKDGGDGERDQGQIALVLIFDGRITLVVRLACRRCPAFLSAIRRLNIIE